MKQLIIAMVLLFTVSFSCAQETKDIKIFILNGDFIGKNTKVISLDYKDSNGVNVTIKDTLRDNHFKFIGFIKEPTLVHLYGDLMSKSVTDNNYIEFLIEPATMNISLEENNFRSMKIPGSGIQDEYASLEESKLSIYKQEAPLDAQLIGLIVAIDSALKKGDSVQATAMMHDRSLVLSKIQPYKMQLKQKDLEFIIRNPNSYLSAFLIMQSINKGFEKDSIAYYYHGLTTIIQNSNIGKEIKLRLEGVLPIRAIFPDLEGINPKGEKRSRNDLLKNNYTVVIFWASWCQPCREQIPAYKILQTKYQHKGLGIVLITLDKSKDDWLNAIKAEDIGIFDHVFLEWERLMALYHNSGLNGIPAEVLLNKGVVIAKYAGANEQNLGIVDLENKLKEIYR